MITSIFSKSRPFNYILVTLLLVLCFFIYQMKETEWMNFGYDFAKKMGLLLVLTASLFVTNFVTKRNGLSKDSTFPFLFFFLFLIMFPAILNDINVIIANFFILLALRRLISLQSLLTPKEKIFDASLWIFIAALFQFWCVLYLVLIFISIIFHVSRDYRNWILPFIALFAVASIFVFSALAFDKTLITNVVENAQIDLKFDYFKNNFENLAISIYAALSALFFFALVFSLSNKPLILHASYKKILFSFLIGVIIFAISPHKSNNLLAYTFMPLAVMATSYVENADGKWIKESVVAIVVLAGFMSFFAQL
ncbi:DUF6427 family protein [Flavobacterium sp. 3HN19-14]|uniref:DUF6427 family protein n=1 Tax=Flavobacterium sp. 3HN19-14 TaxID=3448133 RepID=UPI003EDEF54E